MKDLLNCAHCKPPRPIFRDADGLWTHRGTGFIACYPDGPMGKYAEPTPAPAPAGRPSTPPRKETDAEGRTVTRITVQRACNGCGTSLGDATKAELDTGVTGRPLPDATDECPSCSPDTWKNALAAKQTIAVIRERAKSDHAALLRFLDVVLDDKRDVMRQSAAMVKRRRGDRWEGYAKAYEMAADHIEEALFAAFELWPGAEGDLPLTTPEDL